MEARERKLSLKSIVAGAALALGIGPWSTPPAQAQTYQVLHNFTGQSDGANPLAGMTLDRAGNLYGTTMAGGGKGFGNVYGLMRSETSRTFSVLYTFQGWTMFSQDGANPYAAVTIGPDGALYGTTHSGGDGEGCRELHGCGTAFRLQAESGGTSGPWQETILYQFGSNDGTNPLYGDLVFDQAGNVYGTSANGGAYFQGAVFELTPANGSWSENVVHSFGGPDGTTPLNGPSIDSFGNLFGVTSAGGTNGLGVVYQLEPSGSGWVENVLHSFLGGSDGATPSSNPVIDQASNLYGATEAAGISGGGTTFELTPSGGGNWNISTLLGFPGSSFGGSYRTLVRDAAGNLYGTTSADGPNHQGSVFKLTWSNGAWTYTALHTFAGGLDGGFPYGRLILDSVGNIYGTASTGGAYGNGAVFEITQ